MVSGGIEYRLKGEELDDDVCHPSGFIPPQCVDHECARNVSQSIHLQRRDWELDRQSRNGRCYRPYDLNAAYQLGRTVCLAFVEDILLIDNREKATPCQELYAARGHMKPVESWNERLTIEVGICEVEDKPTHADIEAVDDGPFSRSGVCLFCLSSLVRSASKCPLAALAVMDSPRSQTASVREQKGTVAMPPISVFQARTAPQYSI